MIKRASWFVGGVVTGVAGTSYARRKVKAAMAQLAPTNVARRTGERIRGRTHDLAEAVREGRSAIRAKEHELQDRRDAIAGTGALDATASANVDDDDDLPRGATVTANVDEDDLPLGEPSSGSGEPSAASVIVLRDAAGARPRRSPRR